MKCQLCRRLTGPEDVLCGVSREALLRLVDAERNVRQRQMVEEFLAARPIVQAAAAGES